MYSSTLSKIKHDRKMIESNKLKRALRMRRNSFHIHANKQIKVERNKNKI